MTEILEAILERLPRALPIPEAAPEQEMPAPPLGPRVAGNSFDIGPASPAATPEDELPPITKAVQAVDCGCACPHHPGQRCRCFCEEHPKGGEPAPERIVGHEFVEQGCGGCGWPKSVHKEPGPDKDEAR